MRLLIVVLLLASASAQSRGQELLINRKSQWETWSFPASSVELRDDGAVHLEALSERFDANDGYLNVALRLKLAALGERFAEKEYNVGNYYYRLKANSSAILYYKTVVSDYGATSYAPLALIRLVEAYTRLEYQEEKTETCDNLRRFYPDAPRLDEVCPTEGEGGLP